MQKSIDIFLRIVYNSLVICITMRTKGVLIMKKEYNAPLIEYMTFSVSEPYTAAMDEIPEEVSIPWNDGEVGWT